MKNLENLIQKLHQGSTGKLEGGFGSIKGGMSLLKLPSNQVCSNSRSCNSTNTVQCTNINSCDETTNFKDCGGNFNCSM